MMIHCITNTVYCYVRNLWGYEAIFEYAKLQRTNAADSELINNYSQSVVTLTNRYNDINNGTGQN